MRRIGFVGLGAMGMPMACNLLAKGFEVAGFDLRDGVLEALQAAGGTAAGLVVFRTVLSGAHRGHPPGRGGSGEPASGLRARPSGPDTVRPSWGAAER